MIWGLFLKQLETTVFIKPVEENHRQTDEGSLEKKCSKCKGWFSTHLFNKSMASKDGFTDKCKMCSRQYNKEHRLKLKESCKS